MRLVETKEQNDTTELNSEVVVCIAATRRLKVTMYAIRYNMFVSTHLGRKVTAVNVSTPAVWAVAFFVVLRV
jgi:hypothetical protein